MRHRIPYRFAAMVHCLLIGMHAGTAHAEAPDIERLRERVAQVKHELEAQHRLDEAARQREQAVLQSLREQRDQLADELIDLELQRQRLRDDVQHRQSRLQTLQHRHDQRQAQMQAVRTRLLSLMEQVHLHLQESPDGERWRQASRDRLATLAADADPDTQQALAGQWFAWFDRMHGVASSMQIERMQLHTAGGSLEEVDLLSIGRIAWVYRTVSDGRIGLAVSSPADASGFRFSEALSRAQRQQLSVVMDQIAAGRGDISQSRIVAVPLDVTGRLGVDATLGHGWMDTLRSGGPVMLPLLLVALLAVGLIAERWWSLRRAARGGVGLVRDVLSACQQSDYAAAAERCQKSGGVVGRVLLACLQRRERGQHAMEDSIQEQLLHETPRLERFLGGIAVLAAVAPLLGLLGTVTGIIQTFATITAMGQTEPAAMAGGISEALITTAAGLIIAIPILLLHGMLSGRAERILGDAQKHAATLLNRLSESVADPSPVSAAAQQTQPEAQHASPSPRTQSSSTDPRHRGDAT